VSAPRKPQRSGHHDPLRLTAVQLLCRAEAGESLAELLPELQGGLPAQQRPRLAEYAYGTLRWLPRLDAVLAQLLERPLPQRERELRALLRAAIYELLYMRSPEHAAVSAWVDTVRGLRRVGSGPARAGGLVNALLRRLQREREQIEQRADASPVARLAHPQWLIEDLRRDWPQHWAQICAANNRRAPMSLRANLARGSRAERLAELAAAGIEATADALCASAIRLARPQPVEALPGFADGLLSVQDAAAQQAAALLDPHPGERLLDACAAPGGKTGHLLERQPQLGALLALDVDPARLALVDDNLARIAGDPASAPRVQTHAADAARVADWWDGQPFDAILLDAPCSGLGVVRRHPDIKLLRRRGDIAALATRQAGLLDALWPTLAPGGRLLYATCSVMAAENEQCIAAFLARRAAAGGGDGGDAGELPIAAEWGLARRHGRQILPGDGDMDGFYYALLQKNDNCG